MFMGHDEEAKALYLAHKGTIFAAILRGSSLLSSLAPERLAGLSIGLRHTTGAAAKYSQFYLFEGGQLLRVSGHCEGPHVGALPFTAMLSWLRP